MIKKKELRRQVTERLERNLELLSSYCQPPQDERAKFDPKADDPIEEWLSKKRVRWPSRELLREIDDDVIVLATTPKPAKPILPVWKAYERVDKRMKKLRLVSRVDDLIGRALARLAGQSELGRAARDLEAGKVEAQCLVRDIVLGNRNLGELLEDDHYRLLQKVKSYPLVEWAIVNGHPRAKDFGAVAAFFVLDNEPIEQRKVLRKLAMGRERERRWRKAKKISEKSSK